MAFPINNFSNYNSFNKIEPTEIYNSYLKKSKTNKLLNTIDNQSFPLTMTVYFDTSTKSLTPRNKRVLNEKNNRSNYKNNMLSMDKKFINFCDDMKKSSLINREIDKYNLKRQNNMNINNINYIYINSTFKNICPSINKLLEKTNYNKKVINLYNKDNTHGAWSIGTTDKIYKYRNFFNNKFNY